MKKAYAFLLMLPVSLSALAFVECRAAQTESVSAAATSYTVDTTNVGLSALVDGGHYLMCQATSYDSRYEILAERRPHRCTSPSQATITVLGRP